MDVSMGYEHYQRHHTFAIDAILGQNTQIFNLVCQNGASIEEIGLISNKNGS